MSKIEYYGNGKYVGTQLNVTDVQYVTMNANDGNWEYNVYAVVYYSNGTTTQTATYQMPLNAIALNPITQSTPAILNCPSPVTFSTSFVSGLDYVPTNPADISSYTWSFPSSGWTITSSTMGSSNLNPSVTVTPDAGTAGNVMVTANLSCGFPVPSPVLPITRPTEPPTFSSEPAAICNNSTNTFTINAPCGATSYIWTLSGNAAATFQATGTQSLATSATSAVISTGTVGNSTIPLSVEAVYPGGVTSSPAVYNIFTGSPTPSPIQPGTQNVAANGIYLFTSLGANDWVVGSGTITGGQGTGAISVKVANTTGYLTVRASKSNACGVSSAVEVTDPIVGGGGGIGFSISNPKDSSSAVGIASQNALSDGPALFPNPATTSFRVFIPAADFSKTYIELYDISGRLLKVIVPNGQTTLVDASHWTKGTYMVTIFDGKQLTTKKFVKL